MHRLRTLLNVTCGRRCSRLLCAILFCGLFFFAAVSAADLLPPGIHYVDPNIWAYTADFARRFKLPEQWIVDDLQGAEAVAFRMVPDYRRCGWGGNKNTCNENEKSCLVDVYFDNKLHILPWEERMRWTDFNIHTGSAKFLSSVAGLSRPYGNSGLLRAPFSSPDTHEELRWWVIPVPPTTLTGTAFVKAYDRSIFSGISLVTFKSFCNEQLRMDLETRPHDDAKKRIYYSIIFPIKWRTQIRALAQLESEKRDAFYKKVFEEMKK